MRPAFSDNWRNPEIMGVDQLEALLPRLETAHFEPLYINGVKQEGRQAVIGSKSMDGQAYCYPSNRYKIVQNSEVIIPFARALVDSGFENFSVNIREFDGRMYANFGVNHPTYIKRIVGENYGMRITVFNSYNCQVGFGASLDFVRLICSNGMVGLVPSLNWRAIHVMDMAEAYDRWAGFLDAIQNAPGILTPLIESAKSWEVKTQDALKILYGAGFGKNIAGRMFDRLKGDKPKVDGYTIFNLATEELSHVEGGMEQYETQRDRLAQANKILTCKWEELLADGEKEAQRIEEYEREAEIRRREKKNKA